MKSGILRKDLNCIRSQESGVRSQESGGNKKEEPCPNRFEYALAIAMKYSFVLNQVINFTTAAST
jgi:hypothetical protein